ncbi:MAG: 3-phosphoshikimate 1-carboxyvinyltransferase [Fibrobacter sp.]|nr:3-phosphoshikimate 1-carboxyvinyltransferase [Fibrobacter sp.]
MEFYLNPDRERTNLTLVMALLVNGRTVLEDFSWSAEGRSFANALEEFGLTLNLQGHEMVLTGKGFQYPVPSLLPINFGERDSILLWTLASRETEQVFTFAAENDEAGVASVALAKEWLQAYFKIHVESDSPADFKFRFDTAEPSLKKDSLGSVPYIMRNRLMTRALIRGEFISFEEKTVVRDQWTRMLQYFGVPLRYEGRGVEQLSEFERRLLMAQGKKVERTQFTEQSETKVMTGRDYYVPGDFTEAMALILLSTIGAVPKGNRILIKNVELNSSRVGAINCLKRMGANIEIVTRREKYGDVFGDLEVFPVDAGKRLQGRRFGEDTVATSIEEFPFLAVAACFAEGETILRLPKEQRKAWRPVNEALAENLRKTGVEVGVYDDGLVVRGLENITAVPEFDGGENPQVGLALNVLALALGCEEPVGHTEVVEANFPGILKKLADAMVDENVAEDGGNP